MVRVRRSKMWGGIAIFLVVCGSAMVAQGKVIYVDANAPGADDGTSWENAYNFLQDALADADASEKPAEIRVAQGVYTPDSNSAVPDGTNDPNATFQLINGVTLKGGYAGLSEPDPNARNFELYETILSGDLDGNDIDVNDLSGLWGEPSRAENSFGVVTGSGTGPSAALEGFSITAGNDNRHGPPPRPGLPPTNIGHGAGICNHSGSPTLANCSFTLNTANATGGGMWNGGESRPTLTNCIFSENSAVTGGGMYNSGNPTLDSCVFSNNRVSWYGGGIFNGMSGSPNIGNCIFVGNSADNSGGGMYIDRTSNQTLTNCVFIGNSAKYHGGGMEVYYCSPTIINCIFTGNKTTWHGISDGGGISCENEAAPRLINCRFTGNRAERNGAGMRNSVWSSPTLWNCTFSGNSAGSKGGGIWSRGNSNPTLRNCIIWGNKAPEGSQIAVAEVWDGSDPSTTTVSYSDVEGGDQDIYVGPGCALIWGERNIDADPCFADPGYWDPNGTPTDANDDFWVNGEYHLRSQGGRYDPTTESWVIDDATSPCIDAGDPMSPIGAEPFPNGGVVNMGAYGGTTEASKSYFGKPPCETIVTGDVNGDCVVDFLDFRLMGLHWCEDNNP